jgi:hypothetical protein
VIDLDALKAKLAEYDDARPRCPQKVARTVNHAPDFVAKDDPTRNDWNVTTYSPCCRPEGHEGDCRNSRLILGWPGFVTLSALVAEVERLRAERDHFREAWAAAQVRLDCGVDATEAVREDRDAVVSMLRDCDERCREWDGRENAVSGTYRRAATMIERGEHRRYT